MNNSSDKTPLDSISPKITTSKQKSVPQKASQNERIMLENQHQKEIQTIKLGLVGKIFGDKEHSPLYLTFFVASISICVCVGLVIANQTEKIDVFSNMVTICVGYMMGKDSSNNNQ